MDLSAGLARAVPLLQKAPTVRAVAKWNLGRTDAIEGAVAHPAYGHAARVFPGCEVRSEEHTSETPVTNAHLVCRLLLEKKKKKKIQHTKGITHQQTATPSHHTKTNRHKSSSEPQYHITTLVTDNTINNKT